MTTEQTTILDCGHPPSPHLECTTGYGRDEHGKTLCYACCAERDKAQMIRDGKTVLYLSQKGGQWQVGNWPDSLAFPCSVTKGKHNIARTRYDVRFRGPDGKIWSGVQYGENTQLCHCRRLKRQTA